MSRYFKRREEKLTGTCVGQKSCWRESDILSRTLTCFKPLKLLDKQEVTLCSDNEIIVILLCGVFTNPSFLL